MKTSDIQVTAIHPERWGDDLDVVNAARVSFHKESEWDLVQRPITQEDIDNNPYCESIEAIYTPKLKIGDEKLIRYLAKHKHFSPFNHSFITMRVKAPIFVARQLVKHKFMPWNEVSRRYVDEEPEFYFPEYWRKKADNVKQGSSDEQVSGYIENEEWAGDIDEDFLVVIENSLGLYRCMIDNSVAPEQARMILPQNTMTEWIWSGTLGAWCDMLTLRLDPHTQYESRIVAQKAVELIRPHFPVSIAARLEQND